MRSALRFSAIFRFVGVIAAIAAITYSGRALPVNALTAGFCYLLAVLFLATFGGFYEAVAGSVLGAICLNYYFLPPLFHFTIVDPEDWVALFVFLITAGLVSRLSAIARAEALAASVRRRELEELYSLSRGVLLQTSAENAGRDIALQIAQVMDASVSIFEKSSASIYRAGVDDLLAWDERLQDTAMTGTKSEDRDTKTTATSVRLGADPIGGLVLRGKDLSDSALQSLTNLIAISLERGKLIERTTQAELVRKSDELKSTLLDAIAHEFKTPLTAIKIAVSALRSSTSKSLPRDDLAEIIEEETNRLQRLVTDAIQMSRIEAGKTQLDRQPVSVQEIVDGAAAELSHALDGHGVETNVPAGMEIHGDRVLVQLAIKQLLDNAAKYSRPGSPIEISAMERDGEVSIVVSNSGAGISKQDERRIFDRYFRAAETRDQVPGTGIGLAVVRDIVTAHGGHIRAESGPGKGMIVSLCLPVAR